VLNEPDEASWRLIVGWLKPHSSRAAAYAGRPAADHHHGNVVFGSRRTASTPGGGPGVWRGSEGRYRRRTPMLKATFRRVHQTPKRRRLEDRHRFIGLCSDDGDRVAECPEFFDSLLELHPELGVGELDLWPFLPFSPPDLHPAQR